MTDPAPSTPVPGAIALSLVSHTNAGKTTLARTLLGRDVGLVADAPHVTEFAEAFAMLETPQQERLMLWDTPGFGDSLRLVRRLRALDRPLADPLGWFMGTVWDRWRDRPFWSSQQALRNVRDEADVMLYLVNAAESPEAAGYVAPEMALLGWAGKPVIVLLNQLGPPRAAAIEEAELARWRVHLAAFPPVRTVLAFDAFARCWVQELTLLRAIEDVLDALPRARMARLRAAWQAQRAQTFDAAMRSLAESLARLAVATEPLRDADGLRARLRGVGAAIAAGVGRGHPDDAPHAQAQKVLAQRLDAELRANTLELVRLHGLEGQGGDVHTEILSRLATHYELRLAMDESKAAMWGGMVTGALVGLKADVLSGGLTLGGGLLAGGLLGALGAAGLARCVNIVRGTDRSWIAWNGEALDQMTDAALLRYLAVAHFGRGRGDWAEGESPPHWKDVIATALAPHRAALAAAWASRGGGGGGDDDAVALVPALQTILTQAAHSALDQLYPGSLDDPAPPA